MVHGGTAVGSNARSPSSLLPHFVLSWLLVPSLLLPAREEHPPPVSVTAVDRLQPSFLEWEN